MGPDQRKNFAQCVKQRLARFDVGEMPRAVDIERDFHGKAPRLASGFTACAAASSRARVPSAIATRDRYVAVACRSVKGSSIFTASRTTASIEAFRSEE